MCSKYKAAARLFLSANIDHCDFPEVQHLYPLTADIIWEVRHYSCHAVAVTVLHWHMKYSIEWCLFNGVIKFCGLAKAFEVRLVFDCLLISGLQKEIDRI